MYIAVAGNIGSGKTTLTTKLSEHFGWEPKFESADDNPYLKDFYQDMERWSFHLQIYFLNSRFKQIEKASESVQPIIQDRSIFEGTHIFTENLKASSLMNDRDYQNYMSLYELMSTQVPPPSLMIYLKADINRLVQQVKKRGRDYESTIPVSYLENLNGLYEKWITNYKMSELLVVDMDGIDFVNNPDDFSAITTQVSERLGLKV